MKFVEEVGGLAFGAKLREFCFQITNAYSQTSRFLDEM
ncbi:MAG: hypothetical protein JWN95_821 [Frankiales bacterium]|nr:hypothetical protein [Frankiales bacterium]